MVPGWLRAYRREWLPRDLVAAVVVWSVVVPQAVAYAQIAGLPPQAGLMAAPGALAAYALLGTSRTLVVGATTSTAAVSAAAVAPLAGGDPGEYAALSAALALVAAAVFAAAGLLRLGAIADLISKPVMTGMLFGLGLTIAIGQLPALLGIPGGNGDFVERAVDLVGDLGETDGATLAVGAASIAILVAGGRLLPRVPATLALLVLAIAASALLDLEGRGVAVVGDLPSALPDPSIPDVTAGELAQLAGAALGVLLLSTEGLGVARSLAVQDGYVVAPSRELVAVGGSNALAGLSGGFVQAGGASQTAAAHAAGGRTQLAGLAAAGLVLLTGALLAPLFEPLPTATLAAIVIVAVSGFARVDELARFRRIRRSAIALSLVALVGVLLLGVLQGLLLGAGLSLVYVIERLARPPIDVADGPDGVLLVRPGGPVFYPNAVHLRERVQALAAERAPRAVVLDLTGSDDLDVEAIDALADLARALPVPLRLTGVSDRAAARLERGGITQTG